MKTLLLPVLILVALASACSDKSSTSAQDATESVNGPAQGQGQIDFRAVLVAMMDGNYGGHCVHKSAGGADAGSIEIKPSGVASANGMSVNLRAPDSRLVIERTFGGPEGPAVSVHSGAPGPFAVGIETNDNGKAVARLSVKGQQIVCTGATEADALKNKSLFAQVEKFVTPAVRALTCIKTEENALTRSDPTNAQFVIANGSGTLGADVFSFQSGMLSETASVDSEGHLAYWLATTDARKLSIGLDQAGALTSLQVESDGAHHLCFPQ